MKEQLKRMVELYNYNFDGTITEEMLVSDNFRNNEFQKQGEIRSVVLEVGIDLENNVEHKIFLILTFANRGKTNELVFAFSILDKNNQFVKGKESIYSRKESDKYLPKELQKSIIFFGKLKEMFKMLITMEKPVRFYMETYEDYVDEKLLNPYRNLIPIIIENGYVLEDEGLSFDKKKYYWKFVQKTEQQIKESEDFEKNIINKEDKKYLKYRKERIMESVRSYIKNEEKKVI